jgi:methyltransferase (TIGR00027 family)
MSTRDASQTALTILRSLVMQSYDPQRKPLIPSAWGDPHEKILSAVDPKADQWIEDCKKESFRKSQYQRERMLMPGVHTHYVLRKLFLEDLARGCIERDDFTQVVNLGAGYDSLCHRLHWEFPAVNFFELDHHATQNGKRSALEQLGHSSSLSLLPVDFSRADLDTALLSEPAYDRNARTLFIAEGLLMYLDAKVIKNIFDTIYAHSGPGSCIAFTYIESTKPPRTNPLVRMWLKQNDEPFTWAMPREKIEEFVESFLFDLDQNIGGDELRATYLRPVRLEQLPTTPAELIAVATRP